jgi:guanylate kinase
VDVQGVDNFRRAAAANPLLKRHFASVFIRVPIPELRERMVVRGQDGAEEIARRLETAERELLEVGKFDFVIESRSREDDFQELLKIWNAVKTRRRGQR